MLQKLIKYIEKPASIAPLITFRVLFGALMVFSTIRFIYYGWVEEHYINTQVFFKYFGFYWLFPPPNHLIYPLHYLMIISALGIMLGLLYRISAISFFLNFTYFQLLDLTYYLNHYYFVILISFLLIFVPANRFFSLDIFFGFQKEEKEVPFWTVNIFKFQMSLVYFYAGLAKINYDWLIRAMPLKLWLPANDKLFLIGNFLKFPITAYIFSWAGMLYDTLIPFFLLIKKIRFFAYLAVIVFHTLTGLMFQIGIFPVVMIVSTTIFFSDEWHQKWQNYLLKFLKKINSKTIFTQKTPQIKTSHKIYKALIYSFLFLYISFQILFPWRYLLYEGNIFWTEEGYRFAWRVMLMEKAGTATFYVKEGERGREGVVINGEFLNPHQEKQMAMQPDMILQFAHFLKEYYIKQGMKNPQVRAEVYVTLNARPSQLLINPKQNLCELEDSWKKKDWVLAFE